MNTPPLSLCQVLEEEFCSFHGEDRGAGLDPSRAPQDDAEEERRLQDLRARIHALPRKQAALCISGGGIRSATTGLGVLQGLARNGLLGQFDYLSTVSGGGYIGGWLTAWMHHQRTTLLSRALQAAQEDINKASQPLRALDPWSLAAKDVRTALESASAGGREAAQSCLRQLCGMAWHHARSGLQVWADQGAPDAGDWATDSYMTVKETLKLLLELAGASRERLETSPRAGRLKASAELCYFKLQEFANLLDSPAEIPSLPSLTSEQSIAQLRGHVERSHKLSKAAEAALDALNSLGAQLRRVTTETRPQAAVPGPRPPDPLAAMTHRTLHALLAQHLRVLRDERAVAQLILTRESRSFRSRLMWSVRHWAMLNLLRGGPEEVPLQSLPRAIRDFAYQAARKTVLRELGSTSVHTTLDPEPEPIRRLRQNSNYLDPRVGALSADTWTLGATALRNLLLNWMVLLPALGALLMLPRLHLAWAALPYPPASSSYSNELRDWLFWSALAIALLALARMRLSLPSVGGKPLEEAQFVRQVFFGLFFSSWLLSLSWSWILAVAWEGGPDGKYGPALAVLTDAEVLSDYVKYGMILHALAWLPVPWKKARQDFLGTFFSLRRLLDLAPTLASGAFQGLAFWLLLQAPIFREPFSHIAAYACWATPALMLTFMLASTVYLGLSSIWTTDEDREWHARAGGWILMVLVLTSGLNVLVIYGVPLLLKAKAAAAGLGLTSGAIAVWLGRSSRSDNKQNKPSLSEYFLYTVAPKLAAPIFVVLVLVTVSFATTWLVGRFTMEAYQFPTEGFREEHHFQILALSDAKDLFAVAAGLAAFSLLMGLLINVNKFSLHFMYRNRLIRAYLGASRPQGEREPNPFTGFDSDDNIPMHHLSQYQRPFHMLNLNLNLAGSPDLAWQQRMGTTFTVTPLHAGSARMRTEIRTADGASPAILHGAYRSSADYAGFSRGISLGTAVAVSGAAANPNMGYNSSTLLAFLMTFFNARLGCWLGNPGQPRDILSRFRPFKPTWKLDGPRFSLRPLLAEAFSMTGDRQPYVNLSDGGHFENLALYEMVLRRCHFIMALDNGKDNTQASEYAFEDLGNAIRKIRVDFGVPIEIDFRPIRERKTHFVTGKILYSAVDGPGAPDGMLVLVKPVLAGDDEPADVFNYSQANPDFPQESTSDQWFNESQFESYRILGLHSLEKMPAAQWHQEINPGRGQEHGRPKAPEPRHVSDGTQHSAGAQS